MGHDLHANKSFRAVRDHGLTIALLVMFGLSLGGHAWFGWRNEIGESLDRNEAPEAFWSYVCSGAFLESVGENWESEFLQMLVFVYLGTVLVQRGSPESRKPEGGEPVDADPRKHARDPKAPWPVRRGGVWLVLYEHSLALAFLLVLVLSWFLHAAGGAAAFSKEELAHGRAPATILQYMVTPRFWFESFQNWQSEFLSIAALVYFTVYLRQRRSPQSKPVATPHHEQE
jgi:hypothetical protein